MKTSATIVLLYASVVREMTEHLLDCTILKRLA